MQFNEQKYLLAAHRARLVKMAAGEVHQYTAFNELHYNFGVASGICCMILRVIES